MKFSKWISKHWKGVVINPIVFILLFVLTCCFFNFLLVPANNGSIVEVVMVEAKKEDDIDILFLGSSRTFRGVNSVELSNSLNKNVFNIAYEKASYLTTYYLLKEIFKTKNPEMIFLETTMANLSREKSTEDIFAYRTLTGKEKIEFDKKAKLNYQDFKLLNWTNYLNNVSNQKFLQNIKLKFMKNYKLEDTLFDTMTTYYGKGYLCADRIIDEDEYLTLPLSYGSIAEWTEDSLNSVQVEYFSKIIDLCEENNIVINLYAPPFPYSVTENMQVVFDQFDQYVKNNFLTDDIRYIDLAKTYKSIITFGNAYFYDGSHCNKNGADALVPVFTNIITDLMADTFDAEQYFYADFEQMVLDYQS